VAVGPEDELHDRSKGEIETKKPFQDLGRGIPGKSQRPAFPEKSPGIVRVGVHTGFRVVIHPGQKPGKGAALDLLDEFASGW